MCRSLTLFVLLLLPGAPSAFAQSARPPCPLDEVNRRLAGRAATVYLDGQAAPLHRYGIVLDSAGLRTPLCAGCYPVVPLARVLRIELVPQRPHYGARVAGLALLGTVLGGVLGDALGDPIKELGDFNPGVVIGIVAGGTVGALVGVGASEYDARQKSGGVVYEGPPDRYGVR